MDLRHRFATNLRRIRHDRGISQEDLAYEAGVDRAYVSRIERAVTYVGLEIIGKFAEVLKVDPVEFFKTSEHPDSGLQCQNRLKNRFNFVFSNGEFLQVLDFDGAPGTIRTSDPQIRSLMVQRGHNGRTKILASTATRVADL
jgi:transcriptional regulator with XRE-family HTH domain